MKRRIPKTINRRKRKSSNTSTDALPNINPNTGLMKQHIVNFVFSWWMKFTS